MGGICVTAGQQRDTAAGYLEQALQLSYKLLQLLHHQQSAVYTAAKFKLQGYNIK
jgi:hypothetical protein